MIVWTPVAVNEKSLFRGRGKVLLPEYSAAVIGSSVVLRAYTGGLFGVSLAFTTVPFATSDEARAWVEANRADVTYDRQLAPSNT
jgi:hypothetical protein